MFRSFALFIPWGECQSQPIGATSSSIPLKWSVAYPDCLRGGRSRGRLCCIITWDVCHGIISTTVEPDHRAGTRITRPILGVTSYEAAQDSRVGIARRRMSKKRQMRWEAGAESRTTAALCYSLAASSPHRQEPLLLHSPRRQICGRAGKFLPLRPAPRYNPP